MVPSKFLERNISLAYHPAPITTDLLCTIHI